MDNYISVAIDGPAGAGKSTIAKRVAQELGYLYVDTGAIYRTVGYHMNLMGIGPKDKDGIERCIDDVNIEIRYGEDGLQHMILNGDDVTDLIRTPEMSKMASGVAAQPCVRDYLLDMQRSLARTHNVVMDGRDIGTVVLPHAQVKVYLTASAEARAARRQKEEVEKGIANQTAEAVKASLLARDAIDSTRKYAPLRKADGALEIDSTNLTIDQTVQAVLDALPAEWK